MVDQYLWRFPGMTISLKRTNTPFFIKHFENQLTIQFSADGIVELTFDPSDKTLNSIIENKHFTWGYFLGSFMILGSFVFEAFVDFKS